jgi:hypothetical protein
MYRALTGNRSIIFLAIIIFLQIGIMSSFCLTDLDYSLRKLKYSEGSLTTEDQFHGTNSAKLSIHDKDKFARIYINLDDPLPIQDLDQLSMWIKPQSGIGSLQIEIYFDDNTKLLSLKKNWSEMDMSNSQWNEMDGFDLSYGNSEGLDDIKDKLKDKRIAKIYITIYNTNANDKIDTIALVDYIKIGDEIMSFEPLENEDIKDGPASATPGGLITYTITYGNNGLEPVDLIVKEKYDPGTVFIAAYPSPDSGTFDTWTFPDLPAGAHGQIVIKMRSRKPAAKAIIDGHVAGNGFMSREGMLSTEFDSYIITNSVHIEAGEFNYSASVATRIRPIVGSTLAFGEHGSGSYQEDEKLTYNPSSISAERHILAEFSPCAINQSPKSAPLFLQGDWSANLRAENDYRDISWSDRYCEGRDINLSYQTQLGKTLSYLDTNASFQGQADRRALWPGGLDDVHLTGNFTLAGKARWRWANKTISPETEWLDCSCPIEDSLIAS